MTERYDVRKRVDNSAFAVVDTTIAPDVTKNAATIVTFSIKPGHSEAVQRERALDYAAFLNKQEEAMQKAAQTVTIVSAVAQRLLHPQGDSA